MKTLWGYRKSVECKQATWCVIEPHASMPAEGTSVMRSHADTRSPQPTSGHPSYNISPGNGDSESNASRLAAYIM